MEEKENIISVEDVQKALVNFLANFRPDISTRIDSIETLQMEFRWRILASRGIKLAGTACNIFQRQMWSNAGKSREEAVEVLKRVKEESKYQLVGPSPETVEGE